MKKLKCNIIVVAMILVTGNSHVFSQINYNNMKEDTAKNISDNYVYIRYIVKDVKESVDFYTRNLEFKVDIQAPSGGFAQLSYGNLKLLINNPGGGGGAGRSMTDGTVPSPGGWNRIQIRVPDLEKKISELKIQKAIFRNELIIGNGGKQILLEDPSGNLVELFEPNQK